MTVYAMGAEATDFTFVTGQAYVFETTAGRYDSNLSRGAMLVTQGVSEIFLPFGTNLASAWIHARIYQESIVAGNSYISLRNTAGTETEYRLNIDASGFITVERFKTAAFSTLGVTSAAAIVANTLQDLDIFYTRATSGGIFQIYRNGTLLLNFSGDTDTDNQVAMIRFEGLTTNAREMNVSQVIVANENTVGWKLATLAPDGNGAQTAWTNDYTAIDEFSYNAADFIETNATGQVETFTASNINASFSTYNVKAVGVGIRASNDSGSSVNDIQAAVRIGGTDYFSANLALPKDSNEYSKQAVFNTSPATAVPWTQAEANGMEIGVKSV